MENTKKLLMISYTSFLQKFYQTLPHEIAKQSRWDVSVLVPPYWKELWSKSKTYLEKQNDDYYRVFVGKTYFTGNLHLAIFRSRLKWILQEFQPDIIDLENEPFNLGSLQIILYRNWFSPHSKIVLHASQHQYKNYFIPFNFIEKYVLKHADAILGRNDMAIRVLQQKGFNKILEKVTHGVNTKAFRPRDFKELYHQLNPRKVPLIGFVGTLEEHKGIHLLIDALPNLSCKLILVGDGTQKSKLIKQAQTNNIDIQFISSATHEEVAQYMNCMDIFVLPSITKPNWVEKFGRVLIEAMASGTAIIGSNSGEIPPVLGDTGLIFKEGDVKDLQQKIKLLIENEKQRNELGWKGRKRAQNKYSWQKIASQTIKIYNQILENP